MPELVQRRRGTRVRAQIPLRITSLDSTNRFSDRCHTLLVNPNGCGVRLSRPLKPGSIVRMEELPSGGSITAKVASNMRVSEGSKYWIVGLGFDSPANRWCISPTPPDWEPVTMAG